MKKLTALCVAAFFTLAALAGCSPQPDVPAADGTPPSDVAGIAVSSDIHNNEETRVTLLADFSAGSSSSDTETRLKEIPLPPGNEVPASNALTAFFLADSLTEWTGLDFTLNDVVFGEDGSITVDWSAGSTLIAGLDDRAQKEDFRFFDTVTLNWFMMDSFAQTLKRNLPVTTVYYCSDGAPLTFTNQEDMAAQGLPILPVDQPYEGSAFFVAHVGGRGDIIPDVIHYRGTPITNLFTDEFMDILGPPDDISEPYHFYDGVEILLDGNVVNQLNGTDLSLFTIAGATLDRNWPGLISVLGEPMDTVEEPENDNFLLIYEIGDVHPNYQITFFMDNQNDDAYIMSIWIFH